MQSSPSLKILEYVSEIIQENVENDIVHSFEKVANFLGDEKQESSFLVRVMPQIYCAFKRHNMLHLLNSEVAILGNKCFLESIVKYSLKVKLVEKIAEAFKVENISIILLKGMAFNGYIYSNDCPRASSDIDILIHPKYKVKATQILLEFMHLYEPPIHNRFEGVYENTFIIPGSNSSHVDLHYYLAHPNLFPVDTESLWLSSKPHPFYSSENVRVLSDEHSLIHLSIHALKDMSFVNYGLIDAVKLVERNTVDFDKAYKTASSWNSGKAFHLLVGYVNEMLESRGLTIVCSSKGHFKALENYLARYMEMQMLTERNFQYRLMQLLTQTIFTNNKLQTLRHFLSYLKSKG